jgi:eukaryotic-like serine/threonine-protein kinase
VHNSGAVALTPGDQLGSYVIRSLLGSGGMGEVYLARDTRLDRDVALKLLPAELARDSDRLRRFELEARAASALNHPAIVVIYDLGENDSQPYISMELVQGHTLRQVLRTGPMPLRRALQLAAPIADGLAKAHEAGIVHRDLKPENLMVSDDGFAKILDFGLAKLASGVEADAALPTMTDPGTRPGSVLGTVGYMAPEQARGGVADHRSDQFSFGVVLYEMLTGQRAFQRSTAVETLSAIIRDEPPPLAQLNPAVPPSVRWIVDRCLAKQPGDRYGSTRDLARDLANARDHLSELTSAVAEGPRVARSRWSAGRETLAWLLAAVLGLAAGGAIVRQRGQLDAVERTVRFSIMPPDDVAVEPPFGSSPFAMSPNGRHLAFVGRGQGGTALWLHSFDAPTARRLPGTEGAAGAFWSPDSSAVAFFTATRLKRTSITGGEVVTLCDARFGSGGTWSADGVIVFAPSVDSALFRVPASGGTPAPVTQLDAAGEESAHLGPLFLPDGRHFVFGAIGGKGGGAFVGSLDSPERTRLSSEALTVFGFARPDVLFFMRDRTLTAQRLDLNRLELTGEPIRVVEDVERVGPGAAFAVSADGSLVSWEGARDIVQPTWFRRDGSHAGTLGTPAAYMNVALSADGRQAAFDRFDQTPGIWLIDTARGGATRAPFFGIYQSTPVWSPDSASFAFAGAENAPPSLFVKRLGTPERGEHLLGTPAQTLFPQSWSRDGGYLAYVSMDPATSADLWLLPLSDPRQPVPLLRTPFSETHARISPDGRWLAYVSNESGRNGVYVTSFPQPGRAWLVATDGGNFPVWNPNGRELFYRAPGGRLMAVPVAAAPDFKPGMPTSLFEPPRAAVGGLGFGTFYDVAPDGRFLVNVLVERIAPPIDVVLHWTAGIGRQER